MQRSHQALLLLGTLLLFGLLGVYLMMIPNLKNNPWVSVLSAVPYWCLVAFGSYSLSSIGWALVNFGTCEEAKIEILNDIKSAKKELNKIID